ncbi:helix-turn-helix domain-containing protein [Sphingobium nicotianae]|nr:helix-turn-helix domain-containing protein [Sphingobium nicotianae]
MLTFFRPHIEFERDGSDSLWYNQDMAAETDNVPTYALYGENQPLPLEDFFHCETIAVRSQRYNWEISPHLHPTLSQMLFVARGEAEVQLDKARHVVRGPVLVCVPTDIVHAFRFSGDVVGFIVTVSRDFLESLGRHDILRKRMKEAAFHHPTPESVRGLLQIGRQLLAAEHDRFDPDGHKLHRSLAEAWLRLAIRPAVPPAPTGGTIAQKFLALVETNYRAHKPLPWYAAQLNCTVRTLTRQSEQAFGMPPLRIINRRLTLEASRMLRASNMSCGTVAAELGFEDPSYFSRFYLQKTGKRPSAEKRKGA